MKAAATILVVLAIFAGGIGARAVCDALCVAQPEAADTGGHGHHGHHAAGTPEAAVSANPCVQHEAAEISPATGPRASQAVTHIAALTLNGEVPAAPTSAEAVGALAYPPRVVPLASPPLRI